MNLLFATILKGNRAPGDRTSFWPCVRAVLLLLCGLGLLGATSAFAQSRFLRVMDTTGVGGQEITVSIQLAAQGNENALGFSLSYDPALLSYRGETAGPAATGAALNANTNQAAAGRLGYAFARSAGQSFPSGTNELLRVRFVLGVAVTDAMLSFDDNPVLRETVDVNAAALATTYTNGTITITPLFSPAITVQPTNQTVYAGTNVNLVVVATGSAPLRSQWFLSSSAISGATNATLALTNVTTSVSGTYRVTVSNAGGSVTSSPATLTVLPALVVPTMAQNPVSQIASVGETVIFQASAQGSLPLRYQWRFNNANISGETNSSLLLTNLTTARSGSYSVVVSNAAGYVVSSSASLSVSATPRTIRVANQNVATGLDVDVPIELVGLGDENGLGFTVVFDPTRLGFRAAGLASGQTGVGFLINSNEAASGRIGFAMNRQAGSAYPAGVTSLAWIRFRAGDFPGPTVVDFGDAPVARAIVDINGNARANAFSNGTVTVLSAAPGVVTNPASQTVAIFDTAVFSVTASGSVPLSYQWQLNGTNLPGADSNTLVLPNVVPGQAGSYCVIITNVVGAVTSSVATLQVPRVVRVLGATAATGNEVEVPVQLLSGGDENALGFSLAFNPAQLIFREVRSNSSPANATLNVNTNRASSGSLGLAVALAGGTSFSTGTQQLAVLRFLIPSTPGSYPFTFADAPVTRELVDRAAQPLSAVFQSGTVTGVLAQPVFTRLPIATNVYAGADVFLSADAIGSKPIFWQWLYNGTPLTGQTNPTLLLPHVTMAAGGNYSVTVSNVAGLTNSAPALVQVLPPPADLIPFALVTPAEFTAGQAVNISWSLTNAGTSLAAGPWQEALYLADNPDGSGRRLIGTFSYSGSVNTNQTVSRSISAIIPEDASGLKYVVVVEDSGNWVQEIVENNNTLVAATAVPVKNADLQVTSVAIASAAQFGKTTNVTWVVQNTGNAAANRQWQDAIYLCTNSASLSGAIPLLNVPAPAVLAAGASYTNNQSITLPLAVNSSPGLYYIVVVTDAAGNQSEASEANNSRSASISLTLPPLADLAVASVTGPSVAMPGQPVNVTWAITNLGNSPAAGPWSEAVYLSSDATIGADTWLASFTYTNTLEPGAFILRTQSVVVPLFDAGSRWFVVRVDSADVVVESNEQNNSAISTNASTIPLAATLSISPSSVTEGGTGSATLTRNGGLTVGTTFTLTSLNPNRATVPASITFPVGQQAVGFPINTIQDGWVNGNEAVTILAVANGYQSATNTITVVDDDKPTLSLTASATELLESFGANAATGTLTRNTDTNVPLTVSLVVSDSSKLDVPKTITIPAGARAATFAIATVDNLVPNAPARVTITASASGFTSVPATITVVDDDSPTLVLSLADPAVSEAAANPATSLTITRSVILPSRARLGVQSSSSSLASVPVTATIATNQASVTLPITVYNNTIVDGPRTATFTVYAIDDTTGAPIPGTSVSTILTVTDDDGPTLTLRLASDVISETGTGSGTVTRNTPATSNLVVNLSSSATTEATVPATVTIPVNQTSVSFTITGVSDGVADGTKHLSITASSPGFNSASAPLNVSDIDLPDLRPIAISVTNHTLTAAVVPVTYTVTNSGLSAADGYWVDNIYIAKSPAGEGMQLVSQSSVWSGLPLGETYSKTVPIIMPDNVGTYYIIVIVDEAGALNEGSKQNNRYTAPTGISVNAAYSAIIASDLTSALPGAIIPVYGTVYHTTESSPAANAHITVRKLIKGTRRVFDVWSDAEGNFNYQFQLLPNEAGLLSLAADHPGVATDNVQDTVNVYGLHFSVFEVSQRIYPNIAVTGSVEVANLGNLPLSGLSASFDSLPSYLQATATIPDYMPASGTVQMQYTLLATNVTSTTVRTRLRVTTTEGAVTTVPITITIQPLTTTLVSTPGYIDSGVVRGSQKVIDFDVANIGGIASGLINIQVPNLPWVTLSSPSNLPSMGPGDHSRVTLVLTPPDNTALTLYETSLYFAGENGNLTVPLRFRIISEGHGDLHIEVLDDYTYYVEGSPRLTNALVSLTDPYTGAAVAQGTTTSNGTVLLTNVLEGTYQMRVTAEKHSSYAGPIDIVAGVQTDKSVFIDRETVSYRWTVQPTTIEDHYQVVLEPVFETEVPIPVITLDNPNYFLLIQQGGEGEFEMKFSNHGLVAAEQVTIEPPENDAYMEFEPLVKVIDVFPAQSSMTIPVRVRSRSSPSYRAEHPDQLYAAGLGCGTTFTGCDAVPQIKVKWSWICGDDRRWHGLNADLEYQCVNTDCMELIKELLESALDAEKECLKDAMKEGVINPKELAKCGLASIACDIVNTVAVCSGITDPCALAMLKAACAVASKDMGGAASAGAGLANCICPKISLPSLTSPPPGNEPVPYYESRNSISAPGNIGSPIQPIVFWDYAGADCDPGLHPASASSAKSTSLSTASVNGPRYATTQPGGVCARVRIRLEQEVAITRSAFLGSLEIDNQSPDTPITSLRVTLDIRTADGTNANDRFFIQSPVLAGLTAVDGSGTLAQSSSGSAKFTFIPTHDAAPDAPKIYRFGGTLSYVAGADVVEVPLAPQTLTVYPDPILHMDYFLQRDVFSDDPFTDVVEPADPFALGLLVRNTGKGKAVDFRVTSAQPTIIENEKGLLIDFKIIGTQVSTQQVTPSLAIRMGDIDAGKAQVAAFWMTASLQGKFIEYNATFKHLDSLGGEKTSLIDDVTLHELIHVVRANNPGADASMDFLANDLQDPDHLPDTLYFSDGSMAPVELATAGSVDAPVNIDHLAVQLTTTMPSGWAYLQMPDPGANYRLYRVVRSDGREIIVGTNVWTTDRSFPESAAGPISEYLLHLLDFNSTGRYTLYYRLKDDVAPSIISVGDGLPSMLTKPLTNIDVVATETLDLTTLTAADVTLTRNGGANLINASVTITNVATNVYRISGLAALTATDGNYVLTVIGNGIQDLGGNPVSNNATYSWAKGSDVPVVVSITQPSPNPRNTPVAELDVVFSKAVNIDSFTSADLSLILNNDANLLTGDVTITQLTPTSFRIAGLQSLTAADGVYTITVLASGVVGVDESVGQGSLSRSWTMLLTGPQLAQFEAPNPPLRNTVVRALEVTFTRPIDPATFDWHDLTLTRDSGANLITSDVQVSRISDTIYRLSNFTWVQGYAGAYSLTVNAAGIQDLAGNSGSGSLTQAWTIDLTKPAAPSRVVMAPDTGVSSTDGLTCSNNVTLSGVVAETNLTIRIYDDTLGADLGTAIVDGTNFSKAIGFSTPGSHALRIYAVDAAQNVSSNVLLNAFVDSSAPTVTLQTITPSLRTNALASLDITFNEAIDDTTLTREAFTLSRGGTNLITTSVTLTKLSPSSFRLGNLSLLNTQAANYILTMNAYGIRDLAGNAMVGTFSTSWYMLGPQANHFPVIAAMTNCTVREGATLHIPVQADDPDSGQTLTYSLGPDAPIGATIDSAIGMFTWRPNSLQGGADYTIRVIVKDDGQPSLSATNTFVVTVEDVLSDLVLRLGNTNIFAGQTSSIPVWLDSGAAITNIAFQVEVAPALIRSFVLQSPSTEVLGVNPQLLNSNLFQVTVALKPGTPAIANRVLMRLGFAGNTNNISGLVSLKVTCTAAKRDNGTIISKMDGEPGKVIVVGSQPVLDWSNQDSIRSLLLYGHPGTTYDIQSSASLARTAVWQTLATAQLTNMVQVFTNVTLPGTVFYRARESVANRPLLKALITPTGKRKLQLFGEIGHTYQIDYTTNLYNPVWWSLQTNLVLKVPEEITNTGPQAPFIFYRAQDLVSLARPVLTARRNGTNLVMEWPATFSNFVLESTSVSLSSSWSDTGANVEITNGLCRVTVPFNSSNRYYRLRKAQ